MVFLQPPTQPRARPTLRDVAQLAGVSISTASKALNDRAHVGANTRQRVQDAARTLSFVPNELARGLVAGTSGTIGMVTNDLEGRFSLPILMGAEDAFGVGKVSAFLCDARGDAIRENFHIDALVQRKVDGIVVVGETSTPRAPLARSLDVPVVYACSPSTSSNDVSVACDEIFAGRLATEHLIRTGRQRIAHVTGDPAFTATQDRARGVVDVLAENDLSLVGGEPLMGSWTENWGRASTARLLERGLSFDALICGSDQIARGALEVLRDRGFRVPDDIAVVGFDNWEAMALGASPALTSVDLALERVGHEAVTLLFEMMEGSVEPGVRRVPGSLVVRESA